MDVIWVAGRTGYDVEEVFGYYRSLEGARATVEGNIRELLAEGFLDNTENALEPEVIQMPSGAWLRWNNGFYVDRKTLKP